MSGGLRSAIIDSLDISGENRKKIYQDNAAKLLKLDGN